MVVSHVSILELKKVELGIRGGGCRRRWVGVIPGEQKNLEPGVTWWEPSGHSGWTLWGVWAGLEEEAMGNWGRVWFWLLGSKAIVVGGFLLALPTSPCCSLPRQISCGKPGPQCHLVERWGIFKV